MQKQAHFYVVECLTNMHVGSGESTYSIVDNEVERDSVLENVPIIHASGVKGALRSHCAGSGMSTDMITRIFGQPIDAQGEEQRTGPGNYKFFTAMLLARPLRVSSGNRSYILTTTPEILEAAQILSRAVGLQTMDDVKWPKPIGDEVLTNATGIKVEGRATKVMDPNLKTSQLIAEEYALVDTFRDYPLPLVARNQLDNGVSKNLWYEEIVPHKSLFTFVLLTPEDDPDYDVFSSFIRQNGAVQFGGNASVGYGYVTMKEM